MATAYEEDIAAWALEQVALLRSGQWAFLDVEHIAEEIEDMNLSSRHQLANRMAILLGHLLKWKYQPDHRSASWENTVRNQRDQIRQLLKKMPSLKHLLEEAEWDRNVWEDARDLAAQEANLRDLPKKRVWSFEQALDEAFFPD